MTVIVWDGHTLAADKRSSQSWGAHETVTKIMRHGAGLLAIAGNGSVAMEMRAWYIAGAVPADFPAVAKAGDGGNLLVIRPEGEVLQFSTGPYPTPIENVPHAWGAGADFALGAMAAGATIHEAMDIACRLNTGCGNGVDFLALEAP